MTTNADTLRTEFEDHFGVTPEQARAPGRVNLIGEHTDYNEGFVLPVAIELATRVAFAPYRGSELVVRSRAFPGEEVSIGLGLSAEKRGHWSDYVCGVLRGLEATGLGVPPAALLIDSEIPPGSGLSSSAALEVSVARALLALVGRELPAEEIALLCQRAENEFVGARCGIMDQFVSCMGRAGNALLLDCRSRQTTLVPLPESVEIAILDTGVRHALAGGEYNRRRAECESAVAVLVGDDRRIRALRDAKESDLERLRNTLGDVPYRRARHVVAENDRVLDFVAALREGDLGRLGRLLAGSHRSLREDYEVSCAELDLLVTLAGSERSLVGARMTGGGFGGCTVNLVHAGRGRAFVEAVGEAYARETGHRPRAWLTRAADGASMG